VTFVTFRFFLVFAKKTKKNTQLCTKSLVQTYVYLLCLDLAPTTSNSTIIVRWSLYAGDNLKGILATFACVPTAWYKIQKRRIYWKCLVQASVALGPIS